MNLSYNIKALADKLHVACDELGEEACVIF
jgi:hypothetical protein